MEEKNNLLQQLSAQLLQWDKELGQLKTIAERARAQGSTEAQEWMNRLLAKKEEAQERFRQLETTGDEAWEEVRTGVEKSWGELKSALTRAWIKIEDDELSDAEESA